MSIFLKTVFIAIFPLLTRTLRIHLQNTTQLSPEYISAAEKQINEKLAIINQSIIALNNTISLNLYSPLEQMGQIKLPNGDSEPVFDPVMLSKLCIKLENADKETVTKLFYLTQKRIKECEQNIAILKSKSFYYLNYSATIVQYSQQKQILKYLVQDSCLDDETVFRAQPILWTDQALPWNHKQSNYLYGSFQSIRNISNGCPEDKPFIINEKCSACEGSSYIFNFSSRTCTKCESGTYFSQITHSCRNILSSDLTHCSGNRYQTYDGVCLCPHSFPFWDGSQCISCFLPKYFDFETLTCLSCPLGQFYDLDSCVPYKCSKYEQFNFISRQCQCSEKYPLQEDGNCHPCDIKHIFDEQSGQCLLCPEGLHMNEQRTQCLCSESNQKYSWISSQCECPASTPVMENGKCKICDGYFDPKSRKCSKCPKDSQMIFNETSRMCECGPEYPIRYKNKCISCGQNSQQYYDPTQRRCLSCPENSSVDFQNNSCTCIQQNSIYQKILKKCVKKI